MLELPVFPMVILWFVFQGNADVMYGGKNNSEIKKVVKKVKESYLKNREG